MEDYFKKTCALATQEIIQDDSAILNLSSAEQLGRMNSGGLSRIVIGSIKDWKA